MLASLGLGIHYTWGVPWLLAQDMTSGIRTPIVIPPPSKSILPPKSKISEIFSAFECRVNLSWGGWAKLSTRPSKKRQVGSSLPKLTLIRSIKKYFFLIFRLAPQSRPWNITKFSKKSSNSKTFKKYFRNR